MSILEELKKRKILKNITNEKKINKLTGNESVYIGFDPTASSLHLGNYVQITILKRFQKFGFNPIVVLGGATGMIGDPSGKSKERNLLNKKEILNNKNSIKKQLEKFGLKVIDNYDFYKDMNVLDFFRNVGKSLNINYMLSKDVVASRLEKGISFTEFSYQLIQGWDFKNLYEKENVRIQIGGSDQWGNITTGIEMIRKNFGDNNLAVGITTNLLTTTNGEKFGKSEKNALWIDKKLTTPYELYQYLISTTDQDVEKLLKWLTFLELKKIDKIIKEHKKTPDKNLAQKTLAFEIVKDIHGKKEAENAKNLTKILFSKNNIKNLSLEEILLLEKSVPTFKNIKGNILELLIKINFAQSKREAREFVKAKAISINGTIIDNEKHQINYYGYNNLYNLIKKGKKKIVLIKKI